MQNGNGLSGPGLDATECASRGTEDACPQCRLLVCSEDMATHRYNLRYFLVLVIILIAFSLMIQYILSFKFVYVLKLAWEVLLNPVFTCLVVLCLI